MEIRAEGVEVAIGGRRILHGGSVVCRPGSITALVGSSGCGKTTLLHCLALLQRPTAGRILINGIDATDWNSRERRRFWRDSCAFVLQDYGLMDEESVAFNITMTASIFRKRVLGDSARVNYVLSYTGLANRSNEPAIQLSGGEKQRLAIARALYKDARVVLVDEPTASLDRVNRERVIEMLEMLRRQGKTIIVSTHDEQLVEAACTTYSVEERATRVKGASRDGFRDAGADVAGSER